MAECTSSGAISARNRKCAFTLAEVLITLAIIGVVAAMTLPTVVNKYQEKVTVTKVKKFYSVINQALLMAIKENGYVDEWSFASFYEETDGTRADKLVSYIKPYLKLSKDCGTDTTCIPSMVYKQLNGASQINYGRDKNYYKMILADGSYIWIRTNPVQDCTSMNDVILKPTCGVIFLDVNGPKPPNTIGIDTFDFFILKNAVVPNNSECSNAASVNGYGCTGYILSKGDMKYLYK